MSKFEITFFDLHSDGPVREKHERLLRICATIRILIGGKVWFEVSEFTIVELAVAVRRWLDDGGDLLFNTMEAEETPFLRISNLQGGCKIEAAWQEYEEERLLDCEQMREAFEEYVNEVISRAKA